MKFLARREVFHIYKLSGWRDVDLENVEDEDQLIWDVDEDIDLEDVRPLLSSAMAFL